MATRLDELHGHQYTSQRVVNALIQLDPDPGRRPLRTGMPILIGLVITAMVLVAIPIWGKLTGQTGPVDLRQTSTVLIEKESGTQFVYTRADNQLHPVLNFTSGQLIADGDGATPVVVGRRRLAALRADSDVQLGVTLGIPEAPNSLPRPADLTRDAWQVCSRGVPAGAPLTDLFVGDGAVYDGHALAGISATIPGESLLVQDSDHHVFLIFNGRKLPVPDPTVTLAAFGWSGRAIQLVSAGFLNALPAGPDLVAPDVAGLGTPSRVVRDPVGRLYQVVGTRPSEWAVVLRDRVQPITEVQAQLLQASPAYGVGEPDRMTVGEFARLPGIGAPIADPDLPGAPAFVPNLMAITTTVCARVSDSATGGSSIEVDPKTIPAPAAAKVDSAQATASHISVPFGHGVLARSVSSPTAPATSDTVFVITDNGIRYPIADQTALTRLGYGASTPLPVPSALIALLPAGPALSTGEALRQR